MKTEVAVVGAGITGLVLCDELTRRGRECVVLEAAEVPGGVIRSETRAGRVLDLGPQRVRMTPGVRALLERLGLGGRVVSAREDLELYVYQGGRLRVVPTSPGEFLSTDLLSPMGKLRFLLEPLFAPPRAGETAGSALERKFGGEAYRRMFGPLFGGIYASDPSRMPARRSLGPLWRAAGLDRSFLASLVRRRLRGGDGSGARTCSFEDGMQELPGALYEAHSERVRLEAPVKELRREGPRFRVETGRGELEAEQVVLTVPADAASRLLESLAPEAAARLDDLRYNRLAVVHLLGRCEVQGYGYQVSLEERKFETRGVTWNESLFGRREVQTAYLGGWGNRELVRRPDEEVGEIAAAEYGRVTGCDVRPVRVHWTYMPAYDRSWTSLDELEPELLPEGLHLCASYQLRPGIPGRVAHARSTAERLA